MTARLAAATFLFGLLLACADAPRPIPTASLTVSPATAELSAGGDALLIRATLANATSLDWSLEGPGSLEPLEGAAARYLPPLALDASTSAVVIARSGEVEARVTLTLLPATAGRLEAIAGDDQTVEVGRAVQPLQVRALTGSGDPIAGLEVRWSAIGREASLSSSSAVTDADGLAATTVTVGNESGSYVISARAAGLSPVTFQATARAGAPTRVLADAPYARTGVVGSSHPLAVIAVDAHGNPVVDAEVTWTVGAESGQVSTSNRTDENGRTSITWTLGTTPGVQSVVATLSEASTEGVTFTATALTGAPAKLVLLNVESTARSGEYMASNAAVQVSDAFGNAILVPGVKVTAALAGLTGTVDDGVAQTDWDGRAEFPWLTLNALVGDHVLEFSSPNLASVQSPPIALTTGAHRRTEKVEGDGQTVQVGTFVPVPPKVRAIDSGGNPIAGKSVNFIHFSGPGLLSGATMQGTQSTTASDGTAALTSLKVGSKAGTYRVGMFTPQGLIWFDSFAVAGPPMSIKITLQTALSSEVGSSRTATAKVTDASNNAVVGQTVAFAIASGGGSLSATSVDTDSNGNADTTWTWGTTAGEQSLTATLGTLIDTAVATASSAAASPATSTLSLDQTTLAGNGTSTATVTVQLRDAYGNTLTGSGGTLTLSATPGSIEDVTYVGGGRYTAVYRSAVDLGVVTISATLNDATLDSSASLTLTHGPFESYDIRLADGTALGAPVATGTTLSLRITALDSVGRTVTSYDRLAYLNVVEGPVRLDGGSKSVTFTNGVASSVTATVVGNGNAVFRLIDELTLLATDAPPFWVEDRPRLVSVSPASGATHPRANPITVTFDEPVSLNLSRVALSCGATRIFQLTGASGSASSFELMPTEPLPYGMNCIFSILADAATDEDVQDPPDGLASSFSVSFNVEPQPVSTTKWLEMTPLANVPVDSAGIGFSAMKGDTLPAGTTLTWCGVGENEGKSQAGGEVTCGREGTPEGSFRYLSPAGFTGYDRFYYRTSAGTQGTVLILVEGAVWFVDSSASTNGDGRFGSPINSVTGLSALVSSGTIGDDHAIFLYQSANDYPVTLSLRAGQTWIGQDATQSLTEILGVNTTAILAYSELPPMLPLDTVKTRITGPVTLNQNNRLRGLTIETVGATALTGSGFGALRVGTDLNLKATSATVLSLSDGTMEGTLGAVNGMGGDSAIKLQNVIDFDLNGATGTLQGYTSDCVTISGGANAKLTGLTVNTCGRHGINVFTHAGFTLDNATIQSAGNGPNENGVNFEFVTGAVQLTQNTIRSSRASHVRVAHTGGDANFTMTGNTFQDISNTTDGSHGVSFGASGGNLMTRLENNVFRASRANHLDFDLLGAITGGLTVTGNTFTGAHPSDQAMESVYVAAREISGLPFTGGYGYEISNNTVTDALTSAIHVRQDTTTGNGSLVGSITGNTIGNFANGQNGSDRGYGIVALTSGPGILRTRILGNTIQRTAGGIFTASTFGGHLRATIESNLVRFQFGGDGQGGVELQLGGWGDSSHACLVLGGSEASKKNDLISGLPSRDFVITDWAGSTMEVGSYDNTGLQTFLAARNLHFGAGPAQGVVNAGASVVPVGSCD